MNKDSFGREIQNERNYDDRGLISERIRERSIDNFPDRNDRVNNNSDNRNNYDRNREQSHRARDNNGQQRDNRQDRPRKSWGNSIGEHYNRNNNPPLPPDNNGRESRRDSSDSVNRRDSSGGSKRRQSHDNMRPLNQLQPLMSFNEFKSKQSNNASIDDIQTRYHEKCTLYVNDFSDNFFNNNKKEEWFQDRYNPVKIYNQEAYTKTWAALESENMFNDLSTSPVEVIKAMCLDLPTSFNIDGIRNVKNSKDEGTDTIVNEVSISSISKDDEEDKVISTKHINGGHIAGHEKRTIYLNYIHANCQKSVFTNTIIDAFTEAKIPSPIRVVISQPVWNKHSKFERNGDIKFFNLYLLSILISNFYCLKIFYSYLSYIRLDNNAYC
jgi:hypothetical protein